MAGPPKSTRAQAPERAGRLEPLAYDVLYVGALGLMAPSLMYKVARGKYRKGWREKLGFVPDRPGGPRIWMHAVSVGEAVMFTVQAEGVGTLAYGWRKDGVPLTDDERISGTTTDTLHIDPVIWSDAGSYDVVVTGDYCSVTSEPAVLTVQSACPGDITGDGVTDQSDLGILLALWGVCEGDPNYDPAADLNGDGCINHPDLGILLTDWGCGTEP